MSESTTTTSTSALPAAKFYGYDYLHFWVGNAKQAATYYCARYGFEMYAYKGLETGSRDLASHVIKQNNIYFIFSSPLRPGNTEMGKHQEQHGDGVKDVAFTVEDSAAIYNAAIANGAVAVKEPETIKTEDGTIVLSSVKTYGDTVHTFVERKNFKGFLPGYKLVTTPEPLTNITAPCGLLVVDHIVGNQGWNEMENAADWYKEKLGFHRFWSVDDKQIHTEFSALRSVVMTDADENIKMPINEPAEGKKKSQIEEYVEFYGGQGVQHIALRTDNILESIVHLRARGVEFLSIPPAYYINLKKRLEKSSVQVQEDLETIEKHHILVDFDEEGYLLQIFSKPVEDRPTLFYEIIQRHNNTGFGIGNFKALFQSIEDEQARRGTL